MRTTLGSPVVARVQRAVTAYPAARAIAADDGDLSYAELAQRIEEWRARCAALALPPRSLVCVVTGGAGDAAAAFLGVSAAGLVPAMVDGLLPAARRATILDRARPAAVVDVEARAVSPAGGDRVLPAQAGYVVFSSGSEGVPKGIVGQAAGLVSFIDWEIGTLGAGPGTRVAMLTPPSFDVWLRDLLLPLCAGGELHVPSRVVRSSPRAVLPWLAGQAITVLHAVPSLAARWVAAADVRLDSLRWTLFAGEPLYGQAVARWRAAAPHSRVVNLYGPSETTLAKFWHEVPAGVESGLVPVGRPLPGCRVSLPPLADGDRRIVISTPDGSLGYLPDTCSAADRENLTRADGVTRFVTQDRGRLDAAGNLVVAGRLDSLVKRHGVFLDTAAIESAAIGLAGVRAACCVQLPPTGRVALVVEGPSPAQAAGLLRALQPKLGNQLPDVVVAVAALPLTNNGKVDRLGVRALVEER